MLNIETIKRECSATSVEFHPRLESTNDTAISILRDGVDGVDLALPLLVLCENQTAGRGQRGNRWSSAAGSLTLSWCFAANRDAGGLLMPQLSLVVGCIVAEAIERICPALKLLLKWPNDLLVIDDSSEACKVGGILVESVMIGDGGPCFVVGVGVNVNNAIDPIIESGQGRGLRPASLAELAGGTVDISKLVVEIVRGLERVFVGELANEDWQQDYDRRLAFRGQSVCVFNSSGEVDHQGRVVSVADDGALILRCEDGPKRIYSGTVRQL
jgi:BirA family biotin operon repressor/biotin-[acetyl-CoA-carboxylase] ligase